MALTRTKLTRSESPILLYKSQQFQNERKMGPWINKLTEEPHNITGWTSSLTDAIQNATPNNGVLGKLSFLQRRLQRNGFTSEAVTNIGLIAVINARAIKVGRITCGNLSNTWWL